MSVHIVIRAFFLICAFALLLVAMPAEAEEPLVAEGTWQGEHHVIRGDLVVAKGSVLDIQGSTVLVGGKLVVEDGAVLRLGPADGRPTEIRPLDGRFWIEVEGRIESRGEPRTVIDGLAGNGLDSVLLLPGGLKVNGTGDLQDILIRNGTAGVIVGPGGELTLHRAELQDLYLMGLAVLGEVHVSESRFVDNIISVTGKGSCRIDVEDSSFYSLGAHFQMNSCPLAARGLDLEGGSAAIVVNGRTSFRLSDSVMHGYKSTGLRGDGSSSILLQNVSMAGDGAKDGVRLKPDNTLVLEGVEIRGNLDDAVDVQSSTVRIANSTFSANGGYGLRLVETSWPTMAEDIGTLGFGSEEQANGLGDIDHRIVLFAHVLDHDVPLPGLELEVIDGATGDIVFATDGPSPTSSVVVHFPTFSSTDGKWTEGGPYRYRAWHPGWDGALSGALVPGEDLVLEIPHGGAGPASADGPPVALIVAVVVASALLVAFDALRGRARRQVRHGRVRK